MPNKIFAYIDARTFLADVLKEKQSSNPRYSVRAWAKKLGLKSNAPLSLMLSGKRPVPRKYVPVLAEQLRLGKRETEYFDTLVEMSHVKTFKERTYLEQRLHFLRPRPKLDFKEVEVFECFEDPMHGLVISMAALNEFKPNAKWIQNRLRFDVSVEQIQTTLDRVIRLKLIEKDEKGRWQPSAQNLFHQSYMINKTLSQWHRNVIAMAAHVAFVGPVVPSLENTPAPQSKVDASDISSYTMTIAKASLPKAAEAVREFTHRFLGEFEPKVHEGDEVYQFNVQFVPLTLWPASAPAGGKKE